MNVVGVFYFVLFVCLFETGKRIEKCTNCVYKRILNVNK